MKTDVDPIEEVLRYHARTKHHLGRFAASPRSLDWSTQPDPFRIYDGAPVLPLPLAADAVETGYEELYQPGGVPARPLDAAALGAFLELALGLTAWKEYRGSRWALRANPSSGNLHPTEGYPVLPELAGIPAGVYHYVSRDHLLEGRAAMDPVRVAEALLPGTFVVGLSTIPWREAWKYGERAFRYCQHDLGHALAAVRYAAAALGWSAHLLAGASDDDLAALLGLDRKADFEGLPRAEREYPEAAVLVTPGTVRMDGGADLVARLAALARKAAWRGRANRLSPDHVEWRVIEEVAEATRKPRTSEGVAPLPEVPPLTPRPQVLRAADVIRQRRSALAFDGKTALDAGVLFGMLDRLLPRPGVPPWDLLPWHPRVHPALFVHRVRELAPGLYLLERDPAAHAALRAAMRPQFRWSRPREIPEHLRHFLLAEGDYRVIAELVSCQQEIAADGAFSLGMLAEFAETIRTRGAWWYRRLFWEAGLLGHVFYLEAEAAGARGTGIGCYFDDLMHELLGLTDDRFQSLYHFAVGHPVDDPRLMTIPAYTHLTARRRAF